jgi:hypothetical protein
MKEDIEDKYLNNNLSAYERKVYEYWSNKYEKLRDNCVMWQKECLMLREKERMGGENEA